MFTRNPYLSELQQDLELEVGGDPDDSSELESMYEAAEGNGEDPEFEADDDGLNSEYSRRFFELSRREFESPLERASAIEETLNEMERKYFFGKLFKKIKRGGLKGLVRKAAGMAGKLAGGKLKDLVPGVSTLTQLASGNLKGALGSLAKDGLNMWMPGAGTLAGPAFGALGLQEIGNPETVRREWAVRFAELAQHSFENLADNITERTDSLAEASRAASDALQRAATDVLNRRSSIGATTNTRRIRLRSGDRLMIHVE